MPEVVILAATVLGWIEHDFCAFAPRERKLLCSPVGQVQGWLPHPLSPGAGGGRGQAAAQLLWQSPVVQRLCSPGAGGGRGQPLPAFSAWKGLGPGHAGAGVCSPSLKQPGWSRSLRLTLGCLLSGFPHVSRSAGFPLRFRAGALHNPHLPQPMPDSLAHLDIAPSLFKGPSEKMCDMSRQLMPWQLGNRES